jgi:hypothetical protein
MKKNAPDFVLNWFFKVTTTVFSLSTIEKFSYYEKIILNLIIDANQTKYNGACKNISSNIPPFTLRVKSIVPQCEK